MASETCPDQLERLLARSMAPEAVLVAMTSPDPIAAARKRRDQEVRSRQEASQARLSDIDRKLKDPEISWRKQILERKELDRKQQFEAEAAAAAAAAAVVAAEQAARLAAEEAARQAKLRPVSAAKEKDPLAEEWTKSFAQHREQLRSDRGMEFRRARDEREAMAREDSAAASFFASAVAECERRAGVFLARQEPDAVAAASHGEGILARREQERQQARAQVEARKLAEKDRLLVEERRKDRDYAEWKEKIHAERYQRKRAEEHMGADVSEMISKFGLQGRDSLIEQEDRTRILIKESRLRAEETARSLKVSGHDPRDILDRAKYLADQQAKVKVEKEPERMEQELWEKMLAKTRLARQQERSQNQMSHTPRQRWGLAA